MSATLAVQPSSIIIAKADLVKDQAFKKLLSPCQTKQKNKYFTMSKALKLCLVIALTAVGLLLMKEPRGPATITPVPEQKSILPFQRPKFAKPAASELGKVRRWLKSGNVEDLGIKLKDLDKFLENRGRTPSALVAAYYLTGDSEILSELETSFPDDPLACQIVFTCSEDPQTKLAAARRLSLVDPNNAAGPMMEFVALMDRKDFDGASNAIDAIISRGELDFIDDERYLALKDALGHLGYSDDEAKPIATKRLADHDDFVGTIGKQWIRYSKSEKIASDLDSKIRLAENGLKVAESFSNVPSKNHYYRFTQNWIEAVSLSTLGEDVLYGETGFTALERSKELRIQRVAEMREIGQAEQLLPQLDDVTFVAYYERVELQGRLAAAEWLLKTQSGH